MRPPYFDGLDFITHVAMPASVYFRFTDADSHDTALAVGNAAADDVDEAARRRRRHAGGAE